MNHKILIVLFFKKTEQKMSIVVKVTVALSRKVLQSNTIIENNPSFRILGARTD